MGPVRSWGPGETMSPDGGDPGQSPGGDPAHHIRERKEPATHLSAFVPPQLEKNHVVPTFGKMRPLPATASQGKSPVPPRRAKRSLTREDAQSRPAARCQTFWFTAQGSGLTL